MENKDIIRQIKLYGSILELNGENSFKIRSYQNAVFNLERVKQPLKKLSLNELEKLEGIGKAIAAKIDEANQKGIFRQLEEILAQTPKGVVEMLGIDGLGVKKVRTLWQEHKIEDLEQLLDACENNQIAPLKGFGEKTQENIRQSLIFFKSTSGKVRFPEAEMWALHIKEYLQNIHKDLKIEIVGAVRRKLEITETIHLLVSTTEDEAVFEVLDKADFLERILPSPSLFAWHGSIQDNKLKLVLRTCLPERLVSEVFIHSAASAHLAYQAPKQEKTLLQVAQSAVFQDETDIYKAIDLPYIVPEMREGYQELALAQEGKLPLLLKTEDIKGIIHAHSTYSDGKNTLEEMAQACKKAGYEYLGITDHSQTAVYASGLKDYAVKKQHEEIDQLNEKLAPFKIFKGIESDILGDGSLDYPENILKTFDFVIASVHSSLKMDIEKATQRLIRAIENPYTTMLGHPTGRILLRREGYPIDYEQITEACAKHGVVIEINASPYRLDLDWRWVGLALEKGVKLSINPDAHATAGIGDVRFGVDTGRKGGLTAAQTVNALPLAEFEAFLKERKK